MRDLRTKVLGSLNLYRMAVDMGDGDEKLEGFTDRIMGDIIDPLTTLLESPCMENEDWETYDSITMQQFVDKEAMVRNAFRAKIREEIEKIREM